MTPNGRSHHRRIHGLARRWPRRALDIAILLGGHFRPQGSTLWNEPMRSAGGARRARRRSACTPSGYPCQVVDRAAVRGECHLHQSTARLAFDRWLAKRRVVLADLGEVHIERYQHRSRRRHQRIRTETRRREWYEVTQLLQFLRGHGVCPAARVETTAADDLAARYGQHLQDEQGLATATIERYRTVAGRFLLERFGRGVVDLRALRTGDAIAFVQRQTQCLQPPALKCVVNAMRSFLRYAQYRGEVATALAAAVPIVAAWATTPALPKAISPEHAQRAIDSCDLSTGVGLRDRAVLLLLARLGLALTRSSRCNSKTATGTAATCACAARVGVSNSCRCPPMWARPSLPICSRDGPPVRTGICSCGRWRRSAD